MFTLAISCLTTSNLLFYFCKESDTTEWLNWTEFTLIHGLNIPGSYAILFFIALDLTSITSHIHNWAFSFGSASSFFLELFLHSSLVAYWAPPHLGSSPFSVFSLCLFILFMGFSRQEYWRCLPFPFPVDHILSANLEKVSFHSNHKERQCQRILKLPHNYTHLTC